MNTSSSDDKLQTTLADTSNQPKDGASTSGHLIGQAQENQMIVEQPSDEQEIQEHNIRSPSPSSPSRIPSREELENKIQEYSLKIEEYSRNNTNQEKIKQPASFDKRQNRISNHHESRILDKILDIEQCAAKGFVYALVDRENNPVTGSSDSLRAWWKGSADFDKAGPIEIEQYYKQNSLSSIVAHDSEVKSTTELLMELSDPILGSIMSLLVQHCNPSQNSFQYKEDSLPPWWPTGREAWWGQTGIPESEGPPPIRRPHNLKKKWKVAVILGIIKLMSPNFSKIYNLLKQSGPLLSRMNAKEIKFWTLALVAEARLYCQEHGDMPADEAVAFLLAYGTNSSQVAPVVDRQDVSVPLAPQSNTVCAMQSMVIEAYGEPSGRFQDNHAQTILHQVPFVEQPGGGPSADGTQDVQNQVPEFDASMESDEEPTSGSKDGAN